MNPGKPIAIAFVTPRCGGLPIAGSARLMKLRNVPSWNFRLEDPDRFMLQLELSESPPAESLRAFADLFGLTQAEFRVLALMIEDISPRLIAEHLRISLPTVRTHLQRIRQKTGTRRFSDLIRLALAASKNH
jgi:DNA-binding CsgD family transcriptional regulator